MISSIPDRMTGSASFVPVQFLDGHTRIQIQGRRTTLCLFQVDRPGIRAHVFPPERPRRRPLRRLECA